MKKLFLAKPALFIVRFSYNNSSDLANRLVTVKQR